ncbi:ATP-grasp domain-containing protein [Mangrovimonas aestuarii]|uniref:hypothetical protein n=1 Tax=Mangrovimonas aestuarii TaxID=3018443 RepID=UPI002379DCF7|nr:hypothetical protein [Mangrovimonas aestuarii]
MKKKLNILITGVGGPTPRSFARSLKELGNYAEYNLIGTDITPYAVGHYQSSIFDKSFLTKPSSDRGYWEEMERLIKDENIDIAVILPEQEVFTWSKRQAEGTLPCKALIPPLEAASNLIDKGILSEALKDTGLVPNYVLIDATSPSLKEDTEANLNYPYWIRSATGSSGLGSFKINNFSDLERWIAINQDIDNFIASDYLPGRNLACKMLYYEGELIRSACAERVNYIMAKVSPSGITGNTSFGRLINDSRAFEVSKKAMDIIFGLTNTKKHGFYTVDLKEDINGNPLITEINVRHVAFTQCFSAGGANFCEDTIRLLDQDSSLDKTFMSYKFEEGLIFLRDVDERPIVMKESLLLEPFSK